MLLNDKELEFINKRKKLSRYLPMGAWGCLTTIVTYLAWALFKTPMLFNPFLVQEKIANNQIKQTTLELMSLMFPIAFSAVFIVVIALVALMFSWNSLERKYLKIIDDGMRGNAEKGI